MGGVCVMVLVRGMGQADGKSAQWKHFDDLASGVSEGTIFLQIDQFGKPTWLFGWQAEPHYTPTSREVLHPPL